MNRVGVTQEGGIGLARIGQLETRLHVEGLTQHIQVGFTVRNMRRMRPASVEVLVDSDSGVTTVSEELVTQMQAVMSGLQLVEPFQG